MTYEPTKWEKERQMVYLKKDTKKRLDEIGHKGDSYESIVVKILDYWEKNHS